MKHIPVILFGAGGVGSAVLQQVLDGRSATATRHHIHFDMVAVCDSQTWQCQLGGLADEQITTIVQRKAAGQPVGEKRPSNLDIINRLAESGLEQVIVVDVTAVSGLEPTLDRALELGYGVVLANKKAFAGPWATAQRYFHHPRVRHESTVGGGQPVIATLRYLLDTNDPIYEIQGQLSGTLGYICQQLDRGVAFATAVAQAKQRGYTEPDPREDLGGLDVMRKVMILGRMAGWPLETSDIEVESLYTAELAPLSVPEFMTQVSMLDEAMRQRVAEAQANGQVLRYLAQVRDGRGMVGLTPVPAGSALANLKFISFRTGRYDDEPLMICGKGAGVEMTAAGVVGDMVDMVREAF